MSPTAIPPVVARDARDAVSARDKLVAAAAELLGEVGPRATSVRMVADRAGVNHGLVHHYFSSKDGLLRAAMESLVDAHETWAREQSAGSPIPAPLALLGDRGYLAAVVRCVLDDEMDLARTELDRGVSVPRATLDHLVARRGGTPDARTKALVALGMAMEMGWAALEPFLFAVTDTSDDEATAVRDEARRLRTTFMESVTR